MRIVARSAGAARSAPLALADGLAFACGCAVLVVLPSLPAPALLGLAIALSAAAWWSSALRVGRLALMFVLGLAHASMAAHASLETRFAGESEVNLQLRVVSLPQRLDRALRFDALDTQGWRLRLSWYDPAAQVEPDRCLQATLRLKPPRGLVNASGFDFERYAAAQQLTATGYITTAEHVACDMHQPVLRARNAIAERVDATLAPGRLRALVKALAIGDTRELNDLDWDAFRATGTTHLIAISGLHVGLAAAVGGGLVWLLYWLWPALGMRLPRPQGMALGALIAAFLYAQIAGFSLPTQRTLITIAAMLLGVLMRIELGWWTRYAMALVAVLLIDPLAPLGAGFWLSFGAVAWLILAYSGQWRPLRGWRIWVLPQLGLSVALLPLGLAFFQQTSLGAPVVNLLAVPYVTFVVVPVLIAALATWPLAPLSAMLLHLASWLLVPFDALVSHAAQWPAARMALPEPTWWAWLLAIGGTVWLLAPRGWPLRLTGLLALLPLAFPPRERLPAGDFDLHLLDVGQGQATLIRTANHALLIDTGPGFPDGGDLSDRVLVPSLTRLGVPALDALIVSHDDLDHSGGTDSLLRRLEVSGRYGALPEKIAGGERCLPGQRWDFDGVAIEVLHPPQLMPYLGNESSCVVRVSGAGGSALIPGDIGEVVEGRLVREQAVAINVDVLIAGHHGSAGSSSASFLSAVSPQWVLYSAGYRNRFGFPRPEVTARVESVGARQRNTAETGAITVRFRHNAPIAVELARTRELRWWRPAPPAATLEQEP